MKMSAVRTEMMIYKLLGVELFRIMVFKLEKLIHRKDGGKNDNYHIAAYDPNELSAFIKYLFYNGTIHFRKVVFYISYFLVHYMIVGRFCWYNYFLCVFLTKDLYCILLQRYNYLRIKERDAKLQEKRQQKIQKRSENIAANISNGYDCKYAKQDLLFVRNLSTCIQDRKSILLDEKDAATFERLLKIMGERI